MTCTLHVAWDERPGRLRTFGPGHPMGGPSRLKLTMELARGLRPVRPWTGGPRSMVPAAATRAELELYHSPVLYRRGWRLAGKRRPAWGRISRDLTERVPAPARPSAPRTTQCFPGMHEAAANGDRRHAGPRPAPVWTSAAQHGREHRGRPAPRHGPEPPAGFCVYNDPAIAIAWLLGQGRGGGSRTSDVDAPPRGTGWSGRFWDDSRGAGPSGLHEHPESLFPRQRAMRPIPVGRHAEGSAVNVALPALTGGRRVAAGPSTRLVPPLAPPSSARRSWSASTGATRTGTTPLTNLEADDPTRSAPRTPAIHAPRPTECAGGPAWLLTRGAGGYGATCTWCRGAGPTCSSRRAGPAARSWCGRRRGPWREYVSLVTKPGPLRRR